MERIVFRRLLPAVLFAVACWFVLAMGRQAGWSDVGARLASASPALIGVTIAFNLSTYLLWTARWSAVMGGEGPIPYFPALRALLASVFIGTVTPFARSFGGLVRAGYLAGPADRSVGRLYGPTVVDQLGYSVMSILLGACTIPAAAVQAGKAGGRAGPILAVAGVAALIGGLLSVRAVRERIARWLRRRVPMLADGVEGAVVSAKSALARPATWAAIPIGSAAVYSANVCAITAAGAAIGAPVTLAAAAAAWSLGSIAGVASGTPGGAGTTEAAAILPMIAMGIPAGDALATMLLARAIQYGGAILLGGGSLLTLHRRPGRDPGTATRSAR